MELLASGTIVANRYQLIRKRGSGGVGSVWLAHDLLLDSFCGIKLIDSQRADARELGVRAEREARSAAQLRGTHVVDVFEHGIWNGIPFIVMEFLQGEDLRERLTRTPRLEPEQTYRIIAQVARALVRAHSIGIVHRDLKPDNIFLVPGDEHEIAKLLDFGIARHDAYSAEIKATQTGSLIGTPCYVSPEQARGTDVDWRTDLWALGIVVFECLTGRLPFISEALGELMAMILCEPILPMTLHNPELPKGIDSWWHRASARDPAQRFQSAKQLVDSLAAVLAVEPKLEIPDLLPLGLRSQGVSSLPAVSLLPAEPDERSVVVANSGDWWQSANAAGDESKDTRARRRHLLPQRWLLPAGTAAVLAVVAISAISTAHEADVVQEVPALLRHSPGVAISAPKIVPEHASVRTRAESSRVDSTRKPAPARAVRAGKRAPAPAIAPRRKPASSAPEVPLRACERDAAEQSESVEIGSGPDYGI